APRAGTLRRTLGLDEPGARARVVAEVAAGSRPAGAFDDQRDASQGGWPLKPWSRANTIASARDQMPSLSKMRDRWLRTVFSLRPRRSAMAALPRPSVTSVRMPRSRAVSVARAACSPRDFEPVN